MGHNNGVYCTAQGADLDSEPAVVSQGPQEDLIATLRVLAPLLTQDQRVLILSDPCFQSSKVRLRLELSNKLSNLGPPSTAPWAGALDPKPWARTP